MSQKLYARIIDDIKSRSQWEMRQSLWYRMRNNGLRRKSVPWPNAADMHFPLIDTTINKLKPAFFQQAMGLDVLATFVPMRSQLSGFTSAAEHWFSYKLHEKSNYSTEVMSWIDHMLVSGHGVIKTIWNPDKKQVEFQAIDPMHIIVPPWTKELSGADRITQAIPMSLESYKRAGIYNTSDKVIKQITGDHDDDSGISNELKNDKLNREGLTYSEEKDQVIIWEVYTHTKDGEWEMETFSPQAPDQKLRDSMKIPYDHGQPPFASAKYEITDGGWFSPRGVCEMLGQFEESLCKTWNEKMDASTLFNKPLFRAERDLPNSINLRLNPGQILPFGIAPVQMPNTPMDFDKDMTQTQSIAEQRVTVPDYGIMADRDRRTATEIESINAQSQQNMDLRLRLFRQALGDCFRQAWGLLLQFDSKDLQYRFLEDSLQLDPVALHDDYQLEPRGGMDMVSKAMLLNKAIQRKQLFANSPWINQVELDKSILELEDPSLVPRLVQDPNQKEGDEVIAEKKLIPALLVGEQIPVQQGIDARVRIGVLMQFLERSAQTGVMVSPQGQQAISSRLGELLNAYEQVDTNNARALRKDVEEFLVQLGFMPSKEEQRQMEVAAMTGQMPAPEAQMVEETEAVVQQGGY